MKKSMIALICCSLLAVVFYSCKKSSSSPDSSNFIGRWVGTGTFTENGVAPLPVIDTIVFIAGNDGNHVIAKILAHARGVQY